MRDATFPSPLRGGWPDKVRPGGVQAAVLDLRAVPSDATPSGRYAAISPARGESALSLAAPPQPPPRYVRSALP
jgi:hypothetical protein